MLKLMTLESQKHRLKRLLQGTILANVILMLFITLIHYMEKSSGTTAFEDYTLAFLAIHSMVRPTMIMFACVLSVKLIVDELKTKTMSILFQYPISRSKVMLTKMVMVILFAFLSILLSNLFLATYIVATNQWIGFVPQSFSWEPVTQFALYLLQDALAISAIVLVPIFVGLLKYSVPSTFVTAVIITIAFLTSFGAHPLFAPVLGILGLISAFFSIRKVKLADM